MKKVIIDCKRWQRFVPESDSGKFNGPTNLYSNREYDIFDKKMSMCCMGFMCNQGFDITKPELRNITDPISLIQKKKKLSKKDKSVKKAFSKRIKNPNPECDSSSVIKLLVCANDTPKEYGLVTSEDQRNFIKTVAKKIDLDVEFKNI